MSGFLTSFSAGHQQVKASNKQPSKLLEPFPTPSTNTQNLNVLFSKQISINLAGFHFVFFNTDLTPLGFILTFVPQNFLCISLPSH